ncbi:MAG TPA: hypothetical protein VGO58_11895 [Chitinophagaceae bacterium]|jgi:hypothetical protein|nr:hypothetical protein [Chitinophagaceae bacterium]
MKKLISLLSSAGVLLSLFWGCSDAKGRYLDLSTGKPIEIEKDETGVVVNKVTHDPVYIYVDTKKNDTIYGKTGQVINGHVLLTGDNKYVYDEDKYKEDGTANNNGEYKVKVEDDGDIKIKTDDKKIKIDDGEKKVKND